MPLKPYVLLSSNIILLSVSAVTSRREFWISFNRVAIMILLGTIASIIYMLKDTGIYNSLFHTAVITYSCDLFIYIIGFLALLFSPGSCVNLTDPVLLSVIPIVFYANVTRRQFSTVKDFTHSDFLE